MRWVLDTNVLVPALLKPDTPPRNIVLKAASGVFECAVSDAILEEYRQVFRRPKLKIKPEDATALLDFFRGGVLVRGQTSTQRLPDRKDQPFLDAALESGASVIVSGNVRDFPPSVCRPVRILTPREAMTELNEIHPKGTSKPA